MRMSQAEFDAMCKSNPSLRIASNSASSGAVDLDRYERIRATENQMGKRETVAKSKPKTRRKAKASKVDISPHAKALAYLARHPDDIKGNQEHYCQVQIMDNLERNYPDIYEVAAAIPNAGKRSGKQGQMMLAEGLKPGYPDVTIDEAKGMYHGFRLELKMDKNKPSEKQVAYHQTLRKRGYWVVVAWEFDAAMRAILDYWSLSEGELLTDWEYR